MTSKLRAALAAIAILGIAAPGPVLAQASAAMDAFTVACNANPDFFDFKVTGLTAGSEKLGAICGCLVTAFEAYPEADLAMLTKDLDDSATTEDRTAYGDYTALETRALAELDTCVAATAGTETTTADMTKFDAACTGGPVMLEVTENDEAQRTAICACLSIGLGPRVSTADADFLAGDLDGTATEESHAAHENYDALAELAGGVLNQCFTDLAPAASP